MDVDEREELAALADQLKGPMDAQAQRMRQHLKGSIIPAVQQIKQVHDRLDDEGSYPSRTHMRKSVMLMNVPKSTFRLRRA